MLYDNNDVEIFSVSQLNAAARQVLEDNFPAVWVEGEISNLATPASGHIYFSLKDSNAQIRCAFFRGKNKQFNVNPENGMQVLVKGNISLYEGRGDFQLIVQQMELAGFGALQRQFELLKIKLAQENLFDPLHKKSIPNIPQTIGIITSPTGAAIHDMLVCLKRRYPVANVIIYPCQVQGAAAAKQMIETLNTANSRNEVNVLILARGGGSLEDLWCFNDEALARAIFNSKIPVVTGIGHEVDVTIADFVADVRAATPTAAAELVSPNQAQWLEELSYKQQRLLHFINQKIKLSSMELSSLTKQLRHPGQIIRERIQAIDFAEQKIFHAIQKIITHHQTTLTELKIHLKHVNPAKAIQQKLLLLQQLSLRLVELNKIAIKEKSQALQDLVRTLNTVSPLSTLARGYAIARETDSQTIIRSVQQLKLNQCIEVMFVDGSVECEVKKM